jgi:hypothetical protein
MSLVRRAVPAVQLDRQAAGELRLWTTKDGREIPLDEMTPEHLLNAIRALTLWRARLRKRGGSAETLRDLADAITRLKRQHRRHLKTAPGYAPVSLRPRKPVAST